MIGVVMDTNVIVSAMLKSEGAEAIVLRLALHGQITLYVSDPILAEYESVVSRPKFKRPRAIVTALLESIRNVAKRVHPTRTVSVSRDEPDNRFLEAAEAASAEYLVTGNKRHFPKSFGKTKIVNAKELIQIIALELER